MAWRQDATYGVSSTESCAFCAIASGESATDTIFSNDHVAAFVPLSPAIPGHLLVVPKEHFADIWELDAAAARHLMDGVLYLAHAMRRGLRPDGLNVINSAGHAASQSVFHVHVHLVPRWTDDDFGDIWPRRPRYEDEEVRQATDRIKSALRDRPIS